MKHSLFTLTQYASRELKDTYETGEIPWLCRIIFQDVFHYTNIDIHIKKHENLDESFVNKFTKIITQLRTGKPIQYILGETVFCGLSFGLNPATLIPRPETEELVRWMQQTIHPSSRILDIGTGSGCIAITLAHLFPQAAVQGIDISPQAIQQAEANAIRHHTQVRFRVSDFFSYSLNCKEQFDIIVSNPPYIREKEKKEMHKRVLDFEPHRALFVPDSDPLIFYREIAAFGQSHLIPSGSLFFEINEALGQEMTALLKAFHYTAIQLKKDNYGKDRFIYAQKQ